MTKTRMQLYTTILPRKSILRRRSSGARVDYQLIAANIDVAFIVQSCDVDYNLNRLDRYIVMTKDGGIDSILLLTKSDLVEDLNLESMIEEVRREHSIRCDPAEQHLRGWLRPIEGHTRKGENLLSDWLLRSGQKHHLEQTSREGRIRQPTPCERRAPKDDIRQQDDNWSSWTTVHSSSTHRECESWACWALDSE